AAVTQVILLLLRSRKDEDLWLDRTTPCGVARWKRPLAVGWRQKCFSTQPRPLRRARNRASLARASKGDVSSKEREAMRIAVISDIHGNLAALEEVLADIVRRGADVTVNLGDICASPLWPRETFERLEGLNLPTVRGNHDRWVAERPREILGPT